MAAEKQNQDLSLAILEGRDDDFQALLREKKWSVRILNDSLLNAATKGNSLAFKQLLEAGASVKAKSPIKRTVLHLVARRGGGDPEITKMSIAAAEAANLANFIDCKDKAGLTPLFYAAKSGHVECVRALVEGGACVDIGNCFGRETALMAAAERGHVEVVRILVEAGCRVDKTDTCGYTALVRAASRGQTAAVRELLSNASVDSAKKQLIPVALNLAATYGGIETLQAILETNANLNEPDLNGTTALSHAATRNRLDIVKFLMSKGADVNVPVAPMGIVPLAATLPKVCRDFLHSRGKSNPSTSEIPFTAVHQAASMGSGECLEYMLQNGNFDPSFSLDVCDSRGRSLLAKACFRLCHDVVRVLLEHDADPNYIGPDRATPLGMVISIHAGLFFRCDYPCQMVRNLIRHGSNVDLKLCSTFNKFSCRSLFHAALQNRLVCVAKMLWAAGCNPNIGALSDPPPDMDDRHIKDTEVFLSEIQTAGMQSLAVLSRRKIRDCLGRKANGLIPSLPIPELLKEYLRIPELDEIEKEYDGIISLNNGEEGEDDPDFEYEDVDSMDDSDLTDSSWGDVSYSEHSSDDDDA